MRRNIGVIAGLSSGLIMDRIPGFVELIKNEIKEAERKAKEAEMSAFVASKIEELKEHQSFPQKIYCLVHNKGRGSHCYKKMTLNNNVIFRCDCGRVA